ncbi:MAG: hypothetical protein ACI8V5_003997, partial [Limisphaerales bacterium]
TESPSLTHVLPDSTADTTPSALDFVFQLFPRVAGL